MTNHAIVILVRSAKIINRSGKGQELILVLNLSIKIVKIGLGSFTYVSNFECRFTLLYLFLLISHA